MYTEKILQYIKLLKRFDKFILPLIICTVGNSRIQSTVETVGSTANLVIKTVEPTAQQLHLLFKQ